jgi:hypothetical protein
MIKNKHLTSSITLLFLLLATTPLIASYSVEYYFNEPLIVYNNDGTSDFSMDGTINNAIDGKPLLPMKTARILIHRDDIVTSINVIPGNEITLQGKYFVDYSRSQVPTDDYYPLDKYLSLASSDIDRDLYTSNNWYPSSLNSKGTYQYLRGSKIFLVNLYPVQYQPATGIVKYYSSMTVQIKTETSTSKLNLLAYRNSPNDNAIISNSVDNPEILKYYMDANKALSPLLNAQYLIITNNALYSTFTNLASWKQTHWGLSTYIETVENIYANYSGEDNAAKIRNFIIYAYNNLGTEYVVLGGDADAASNNQNAVIPHRGLYGKVGSYYDNDIPADLYYGCLDGGFNGDGDGVYGETNDGPNGGDVDLCYDVYVGRICAQTTTEASYHINKIISYETNPAPYKALLIGEKLDSYPTWGGDYKDAVYQYMNNMPKTTLYQRDGTFSAANVINAINSNTNSVLNHMGHANNVYNMGLNYTDVVSLTNTTYLWAYTQGCYSGAFDNRDTGTGYYSVDCMGEYFTCKYATGGFASYIGNSRYGWYSPGSTNGTSNIFDMQMMNSVFQKNIKNIGHSLADSKQTLIGISGSYNSYRWVYFELNLLGDPHMYIKLDCPTNSLLISQFIPPSKFFVLKGYQIPICEKITDGCGSVVNSVTATATFNNGDSPITLYDNGTGADQTAGDGFYSGYWTPQHNGTCIVTYTAEKPGYNSASGAINGYVTNINYQYDDNCGYEWIDATSGIGTILGDEDYISANIGFTFNFYDTPFTQLYISSNGYLKFGPMQQEFENSCIPFFTDPNSTLDLYWDDIYPKYSNAVTYYKTFGTAPNRYFVVEYKDVYIYGNYNSTGTFEVILYEGSNLVKYQYQDVNFGSSDYNYGMSATIGIESSGGTLGTQYSCNEVSLTNNQGICFYPLEQPIPTQTATATETTTPSITPPPNPTQTETATTTQNPTNTPTPPPPTQNPTATPTQTPDAITLEYFTAKAENDKVVLNWKTGTEIDTLGYYIVKSEDLNNGYTLLNDRIIPVLGNPYSGFTYYYMDYAINAGHIYYYWLIDIDQYGDYSIHGPVKAITNIDRYSIEK